MANQQTSSKAVHIALWVAQVVLAVSLIWAAWMKLFQPIDQLARMWPWAGQVHVSFVRFTGIIDLLGALGLILPALLRVRPALTPITASCIVALMVCASIFHIMRGEASVIGVNIVFALMAIFIVWGRFRKTPIAPK